MLHPITFSIPLEKVVTEIPKKTKILSDLIPGKLSTYIYTNETDYYNEYKQSYFATTTKKAGWDCMRHYEIIANGCVPYFPNIESCPPRTMALLPKDLIVEGNTLYKIFLESGATEENVKAYFDLTTRFLKYMRDYLTTHRLAQYVLNKIEFKKNVPDQKSNILFLSGSTYSDYLRCLTLHGFKSIFGSACHDYPKIPHIYKTYMDANRLYGKGISYSNLLEDYLHDDSLDTKIETLIKKKYFDLIIYGSYHRGLPFFDLVNELYKPNEIVMICGEDIHDCNYGDYVKRGYNLFVREL